MTYYRIMECVCGAVVADFGWWRVLWSTGEAHNCAPQRTDDVDDLTAQALAGQHGIDHLVAEAASEWLMRVGR